MANFKKLEVAGASKVEAMAQVTEYFALNENGDVKGDATQAWKNWTKTHGETEASKKEFMGDYLTKKKALPGEAYRVTINPAVADSRERPYTCEDCKHEGTRDTNKAFVLYDENRTELGRVSTAVTKDGKKKRPTKTDAKSLAKELIKNGFHGTITCELVKEVSDPVVFTMKYAPSKNTRVGTWVVFGYVKD